MDREGLNLTRRPLLPLDEGLREPHKADRVTNRLRKLVDKFASRRLGRAAYNRRQRHLYKARPRQPGERPVAPTKHLGVRLRSR